MKEWKVERKTIVEKDGAKFHSFTTVTRFFSDECSWKEGDESILCIDNDIEIKLPGIGYDVSIENY